MSRLLSMVKRIWAISWVRELFRGSFRPAPVAAWEMFVMRALFAWVVWQTFPVNLHYEEQRFPNGVARWDEVWDGFDLTWLWSGHKYEIAWIGIDGPVTAMQLIRAGVAICLLIYASGYGLPLVLPLLTAASIIVRTYYNSQGAVHHGCQMVALILFFQTFVVLYFAGKRATGWIKRKPFKFDNGLSLWSYFLFYSQGAIAGCYVIAGLTKIVRTGGAWFWNSPYMALEIIKTEKQEYYSHLDESVLGTQTAYAEWMLNYPNLARVLLSGGVFLELFAIFMLFNRQAALAIGVGMVLFHHVVAIVMELHFRFNEYSCWIFCINLPFWLVLCLRKAQGQGNAFPPGSASSAVATKGE
jgi:hypothetical protein